MTFSLERLLALVRVRRGPQYKTNCWLCDGLMYVRRVGRNRSTRCPECRETEEGYSVS